MRKTGTERKRESLTSYFDKVHAYLFRNRLACQLRPAFIDGAELHHTSRCLGVEAAGLWGDSLMFNALRLYTAILGT